MDWLADPCIDLEMAGRLDGMRDEDVAAARASGRSVREMDVMITVGNGG